MLEWVMCFVILVISLVPCVYSSVPAVEVQALHSLYTATNGDAWTYNDSNDGAPWNFSAPVEYTDPCGDEWMGVTCSSSAEDCVNTTCSIEKLNLGWFNMRGIMSFYYVLSCNC